MVHPTGFPKFSQAKDRVEALAIHGPVHTACFIMHLRGSGARKKWNDTVERKICDDGMHIADLLCKLKTVERSLHPGTDAKSFFYLLCA